MAHADERDGPTPGTQLLDDEIASRQHAATYAVLVDTLASEDGKKSHAIDRVDVSTGIVHDIYDAMEREGLVEQEGERRGATYSVTPRAVQLRDDIDVQYPGWTEELDPFWRAAYDHEVADDLIPVVNSTAKQEAVTTLAAGIAETDEPVSGLSTLTDISYNTVNELRGVLENRGYVRSEGEAAATTYHLTERGEDALLPLAAAAGIDYTGLPYAETDWTQAAPADPDAWVEELMSERPGTGDARGGPDPEQVWRTALAAVHAERSDRSLAESLDRYGADVDDPDAVRAAMERGILHGMLAEAGEAGRSLGDAVGDLRVEDDRHTVPEETLADLADGLPGMAEGKRTVLAYLGEHGDAARDDMFDVLDIDNRSIGQSVRYLREDGLVAEEDGAVTLTDAGEELYEDPDSALDPVSQPARDDPSGEADADRSVSAGPGPDLDIPVLGTIIAELRKGNGIKSAVERSDMTYGPVKERYDTAERLGLVSHSGPNWHRNYTVDDGAMAEAGVLEDIERHAAPSLIQHAAEQAAGVATFANIYDRANHRFRELWDADELPEDLIIPQWQEVLAAARASAFHDGTLAEAAVWVDSTPSALADHLERLPEGDIELYRPDEDTYKKDRRVLLDRKFEDAFEAVADRLVFDPAAVTYQDDELEEDDPLADLDIEVEADDGTDDGPEWTDFRGQG